MTHCPIRVDQRPFVSYQDTSFTMWDLYNNDLEDLLSSDPERTDIMINCADTGLFVHNKAQCLHWLLYATAMCYFCPVSHFDVQVIQIFR